MNFILNNNINFEKLEIIKLIIPYTENKIENKYINQQLVDFIDVANLRETYDYSQSDFFPEFFKFIFDNQIINIKTNNKKDNNINEIEIKFHDDYGGYIHKTTKYIKKNKDVSVTIKGTLFGINNYGEYEESAIKNINLDNIKIDQNLDSFLVDGFNIEQLNQIKNYLLTSEKELQIYLQKYYELLNKSRRDNYISKESKEKYNDELNEKIEKIKKIRKANETNPDIGKNIAIIKDSFFLSEIKAIEKLLQIIESIPTKKKIYHPKKNYYDDFPVNDLFD